MSCSDGGYPAVHYLSHDPATGYGVAGRRLVMALADRGVPLRWSPLRWSTDRPLAGPDEPGDPELDHLRACRVDADVVVAHTAPEIVAALGDLSGPRAAPVVCHTVWEHDVLQPHWPELLNRCDGVIVPTEWNAASFRNAGVSVPVAVVPHVAGTGPVDDRWLGPAGIDVGDDAFVVHSIATWSWRKQPWQTVLAFARAFGPDDGAVLVFRTDRWMEPGLGYFPGPERRRTLSSWTVAHVLHDFGPTGQVHLIHDLLTFPEVAALHRRSDCWLSLPHAEGWDLGAFDAACAGTPVVTSDHHWSRSYLDPATSALVPSPEVPYPGLAGATWVEPDVDWAVKALRAVRADPEGARQRAGAHAAELRREFSPEAVSQRFLDALVEMGVV